MGLTAAMSVGRTALASSQAAIQVIGNNIANAATPGYSRQIVSLGPTGDNPRSVPGGTPGSSASDAPDGSASAWHKKAA